MPAGGASAALGFAPSWTGRRFTGAEAQTRHVRDEYIAAHSGRYRAFEKTLSPTMRQTHAASCHGEGPTTPG